GEGWKAWASAPMIILFAQTVQPLILLAIYMFLPLVLVIGRFSFRVMFLGALAIFTVKGWTAMWFIANWLYDHMLVAMYPSTLGLLHALLKLNLDESMKRIVLNTTLIAMYLGFPLIWTSMLAWVGYQVAGAMGSAAKGSIATGAAAGAAGARMGSQVAGSAAGAASRGITKGLGK
ncbi:MAG: conjugal transfer protein TraG N-terminal domain-containing protein, partial [Rhodocyclaceae bacterium]|nr:conjugal transfer protein TraG N-terminal domain-containing protein [Rhodocyclaceae bacterium]